METVVIFCPPRNLKKKKKIKALFTVSFNGLIKSCIETKIFSVIIQV